MNVAGGNGKPAMLLEIKIIIVIDAARINVRGIILSLTSIVYSVIS